jgi:DNA repair protein RadC
MAVQDERAGIYTASAVPDYVQKAAEWLKQQAFRDGYFTMPDAAGTWLRMKLAGAIDEHFGALYLDNKHGLIADEIHFTGTIDGAAVYPRTIVRRALELNAAAVIFYHNHPSGNPEPSEADRTITRRLSDALKFVDIRVLDHLVVGDGGWVSMAEKGWL